jgi:hypothetical protein
VTDEREPRGPDPVARWLGDDRAKPPPGRFRFEDSEQFLRELDEVISPTYVLEYDGRYNRRYAPTEEAEAGGESWSYIEHCSCDRCAAVRRLRNPTPPHPYQDEWDRARADYTPQPVAPCRLPRARSTSWRRSVDLVVELQLAYDEMFATRQLRLALVTATSRMGDLTNAVRTATVNFDVLRTLNDFDTLDDRDAFDRWADDGGAIGVVDY